MVTAAVKSPSAKISRRSNSPQFTRSGVNASRVIWLAAMGRRDVDAYSALLARAFNGAITVNGQRIVAHPSGTLIERGPALLAADRGGAGTL